MEFKSLSKIELHLHLDCSLSFQVVRQLDPGIDYDTYQKEFIAPAKCTDLADYITRATKGVELMQTSEQLRLVTLDLFEQLRQDGVIYAEIRFAPLLHTKGGLSPSGVVQAVHEAVQEGIRRDGLAASLILCTLRHFSEAQSMETVELVHQFRGTSVVAFDIAADEAGFPIDNHIKAFRFAKSHGIPCTAHAGEAKGAQSVWETLENFQPSRIGHGVRSIEDPSLIEFLKQRDIHLEVCPTSNIQVNVFDTLNEHPADRLYKAGVSMSINTDARTISDTTLTREYGLLQGVFDWETNHFLHCNLEAIRHAFLDEETKARLTKKILSDYNFPVTGQ